jgi:hypothetical protein
MTSSLPQPPTRQEVELANAIDRLAAILHRLATSLTTPRKATR